MKENIHIFHGCSISHTSSLPEKLWSIKAVLRCLGRKKSQVKEIVELVGAIFGVGGVLFSGIYLFLVQLAEHGW